MSTIASMGYRGKMTRMTIQVITRKIDVDTHFYPPVDYKTLREYLPQGLVAQARDMLVRDARQALEPKRVAAETSGAVPPTRPQADPHRDADARAAAMDQTGFELAQSTFLSTIWKLRF